HIPSFPLFFHFNHPPAPPIYTLSLHDALPISRDTRLPGVQGTAQVPARGAGARVPHGSARLSDPRRGAGDARGRSAPAGRRRSRSEEHTSELQSPCNLVCRLLLEKKKKTRKKI